MKKLFDSKFLFILALSLIVLIVLGVSAFYLFDNKDDIFVKSGYVLNPLSAKQEKYYFNESVGYHENLSSMVEFKDIDNNDVKILRDSFLHYTDGSLSFLKNGAILDIESIKGSSSVALYNITNKSIIDKSNDGYVIENTLDDIRLKNFIGRINQDKYIIAGKIVAKIPGNNTEVSGDYFEFVYLDNGVVNIENKDVKYQVTAEGTYFYVGDVVIDLGNKKITKGGNDVMSITSITIDGNENIEIIPKEEEKKPEPSSSAKTDNGENKTDVDKPGSGGSGSGDNQPGDINKDNVMVNLKNAKVGSTSVTTTFDIESDNDSDTFSLKVTNLESGRTVDVINNVVSDEDITINLLSPNTKYLFTVVNNRDQNKYFQKVFETTDFGIKLEKLYASDSELAYRVMVDQSTDITNAKLTLYKYNEETKKNEVVTTKYHDASTGEDVTVEKIVELSSIDGNIEGVHDIVYDGLDSDTIYTAVLDDFSLITANFKDVYNLTLTSMTLKKTPSFSEMTVNKNVGNGSFKLAFENIVDPDNAIVNYTYLIYKNDDRSKTAINPISKTNASPIEVMVGEGENQLKNDTNYVYKVLIEYFDNEKYIEYVTSDSINFVMGSEPYVTVVPNYDVISYDRIGATIYLVDNSCLIAMPGRENCDGANSTVVNVHKINPITGDSSLVFTRVVDFTIADGEMKYELELDKLQAGTTYTVEIRADRSDKPEEPSTLILHSDESVRNITTKSLSSFIVGWNDAGSNANHVVNLDSKLVAQNGSGTLSPDDTARSIEKVIIKLYEGNYIENLQSQQPIATKTFVNNGEFNIKENFYDNVYTITSDGTFGLDMAALKDLNTEKKLSEYYTVAMYAYYDTDGANSVVLNNNVTAYKISPILLADDIEDPVIAIEPITKKNSNIPTNLINDGTIVGYTVTAAFDRSGLLANALVPERINMYVYDKRTGSKVNFYVESNGGLQLVNKITSVLDDSNYYEDNIYIGYGSEYTQVDVNMSRGNEYYIGYELEVIADGSTLLYPTNRSVEAPSNYGVYELVKTEKETPTVKMYVSKSTANNITYKYEVRDPDKALYRENTNDSYGLYYKIGEGNASKINLTKVDGDYNIFSGQFTISNLNMNDIYSIYYKKNVTKTGVLDNDVLDYFDGKDGGSRLFEGLYVATDTGYNFKFEVINNPLTDNKVTIKILATENIINRILSYKVKFSDSKGNNLDKEVWKLTSCGDEDTVNRCFTVDYIELKNAGMKSENNNENVIRVSITALYDNGLTGYDYTVGDDKDYKYMIMQGNNTGSEIGKYISFSNLGQLTEWSDLIEMPKGYYTYYFLGNQISYNSKLNTSHRANITLSLSSSGYTSNFGPLNPKMISIDNMSSQSNTFSFSSITPKIAVSRMTSIINGAVADLTLSGADIADFCESGTGNNCVNNNSSEHYLYVEVWDNQEDVGNLSKVVRPTLKFKINKSNPTESISAVIDKLSNAKTYYFNVYAYLNKNDVKVYTQLFDVSFTNRYEAKTYDFTTLSSDDIFHNYEIGYKPSNGTTYGNRELNTKINLLAYANSVPFNYGISYAFCEYEDSECGMDHNIFSSSISVNGLSTVNVDNIDISSYNLEYGKDYYVYIFANFEYYDEDGELKTKSLHLNRRSIRYNLKALTVPDFVIGRDAKYIDGDYVIDLNINVHDIDETLIDGEYFVKLIDESSNVVGNLQVKGNDATYVTVASDGNYVDYALDASVVNRTVRITGLTPDTKYTAIVYGKAFMNNYSETVVGDARRVDITKMHTVYTVNTSGVAFGRDLLFSATEKSIVVTFLGGSNFSNVSEVDYTIGLWDDNQSTSTFNGSYILSESNKKFEINADTGEWRFVIDPEGMTNVLGQTYTVALAFYVRNDVTGEIDYFDSVTNPAFSGRTQYVKDNK